MLHQRKQILPDLSFEIQNREVNNVQNITIVKNAITKSGVWQRGPPTNAKVGIGA
jgi:hypothetical protein